MATDASDEHAPAQPDPPPDPWAGNGDPWAQRRAERQAQNNSQGFTETWDLAEAGTQATASNGAAAQAGAPSDAERAYTHNNGGWDATKELTTIRHGGNPLPRDLGTTTGVYRRIDGTTLVIRVGPRGNRRENLEKIKFVSTRTGTLVRSGMAIARKRV